MKNLKKGDKVYYRNTGYGMTSYEGPDKVLKRKGEKLYTETFDSSGLDWNGHEWVFDSGLGLVTHVQVEKPE
jgi:hypothetical protein